MLEIGIESAVKSNWLANNEYKCMFMPPLYLYGCADNSYTAVCIDFASGATKTDG